LKENTVYLYYADSDVLAGKADVPDEFVFRGYVVYSVPIKYRLDVLWIPVGLELWRLLPG